MPKQEDPIPWTGSQAAVRQPYPRRNVYFSGRGMGELLDYCIWQAHVRKRRTLFGKQAHNSSAVIVDILAQDYLATMREPGSLESFFEWRARHIDTCEGIPLLLVLAIREMLNLVPSRSDFAGSLKEWGFSSKEHQQLRHLCDQIHKLLAPEVRRKKKAS
jgi:hypothetical protein